jgi:hypothetical protein
MSPIRTYLKAGLDRARIARYNHQVSSDAALVRAASERVERLRSAGGLTYI